MAPSELNSDYELYLQITKLWFSCVWLSDFVLLCLFFLLELVIMGSTWGTEVSAVAKLIA